MRRIVFKHQVENLGADGATVAIRGEKWKNATQALKSLDTALKMAGTGWWPHLDRYTGIAEQIEVTDQCLASLGDVRETIDKISDRSYDTALTEYHLGMLFGFDAEPFIILAVLGERLCENFDNGLGQAAKRLEEELYEVDDEEPEWWMPVNAAAVEATHETLAWLKEVQLFKYRLGKAAENGLDFF